MSLYLLTDISSGSLDALVLSLYCLSLFLAMNAPLQPLCTLCGRPGFLYGRRDPETGWLGWCTLCNAKWHTVDCRKRLQCTQLLLRFCKSHVKTVTQLIIDFLVPNRREIVQSVMKRLLKRFLLGSSMAYYNARYGQILEPDTDDELEDGVADPTLNYLNPLWKLRLVRSIGEISTTGSAFIRFGRPFELVCAFIGGISTTGATNPIMIGVR